MCADVENSLEQNSEWGMSSLANGSKVDTVQGKANNSSSMGESNIGQASSIYTQNAFL